MDLFHSDCSIGLRETKPYNSETIKLHTQHFVFKKKGWSNLKRFHWKKQSYLSPVPSQTPLSAPSIFIPMTSNHLSYQSSPFHPWTLKFFTEGETHCNLITESPGEPSTWVCGREMKGEDCSWICDCGFGVPRGGGESTSWANSLSLVRTHLKCVWKDRRGRIDRGFPSG